MKQLLFGNPHTDFLRFRFDAVSTDEALHHCGCSTEGGVVQRNSSFAAQA
jgi:hypothetical protein